MKKQISTKNRVLMMTDGSKVFLTNEQAEKVIKDIKAGAKWIEIAGDLINTFVVSKVVGLADYEEVVRKKKGDYQCSCGNWVPRGKSCGKCQA